MLLHSDQVLLLFLLALGAQFLAHCANGQNSHHQEDHQAGKGNDKNRHKRLLRDDGPGRNGMR